MLIASFYWSDKVELGAYPPATNQYLVLGFLNLLGYCVKVVLAIYKEVHMVDWSDRCEGAKPILREFLHFYNIFPYKKEKLE